MKGKHFFSSHKEKKIFFFPSVDYSNVFNSIVHEEFINLKSHSIFTFRYI